MAEDHRNAELPDLNGVSIEQLLAEGAAPIAGSVLEDSLAAVRSRATAEPAAAFNS